MRPITGITILGLRLGVIALAVYWIALFAGTHWPSGVQIATEVSDKLKHFTAFFGLALLCCYVTSNPPNDRRATAKRFLKITLSLSLYACIDELTQAFIPGRYPDWYDVLADIAGILAAITLYWTTKRILKISP